MSFNIQKRLSSIFKKAALCSALGLSAINCASEDYCNDNSDELIGSPLGEHEISLTESLFGKPVSFKVGGFFAGNVSSALPSNAAGMLVGGVVASNGKVDNSVKTCRVRKIFKETAHPTTDPSDNVIATAHPNMQIRFYAGYHSADYAKDPNVTNFGIFAHEMTHLWQYQKVGVKNMPMCNVYYYQLDNSHGFFDYCVEQQAAIIEDYARRFLHPAHRSARLYNTPANDILLQNVVEAVFPQARESRLAYNDQQFHSSTQIAVQMNLQSSSTETTGSVYSEPTPLPPNPSY